MLVSSRLCIVNRRSPVLLRGTRSAQPINLVRSLTNRALQHCSTFVIDEELKTLRTILSRNCYPGYILAKLVARDLPERRIDARFCPLVLQVPWLGKRTEDLVRKANNASRLAYFAGALHQVYRTMGAFSVPKARLPTLSPSNVIYLYECPNCGERYVGRTEQRLADWSNQHVPKHIITEPEPGRNHVVDHRRREATQRRGTTPRLRVI